MTNGAQLRGVITDWGGVLTTPILTTVQAWIRADGIDWDSYRTVMRSWVFDAYGSDGSQNPVHALERGECTGAEFEQLLAARLLRTDGGSVIAEGILRRMFAASTACGMTGVHHTEAAQTVAAVQDLLGVPLNGARPAPGQDA